MCLTHSYHSIMMYWLHELMTWVFTYLLLSEIQTSKYIYVYPILRLNDYLCVQCKIILVYFAGGNTFPFNLMFCFVCFFHVKQGQLMQILSLSTFLFTSYHIWVLNYIEDFGINTAPAGPSLSPDLSRVDLPTKCTGS